MLKTRIVNISEHQNRNLITPYSLLLTYVVFSFFTFFHLLFPLLFLLTSFLLYSSYSSLAQCWCSRCTSFFRTSSESKVGVSTALPASGHARIWINCHGTALHSLCRNAPTLVQPAILFGQRHAHLTPRHASRCVTIGR